MTFAQKSISIELIQNTLSHHLPQRIPLLTVIQWKVSCITNKVRHRHCSDNVDTRDFEDRSKLQYRVKLYDDTELENRTGNGTEFLIAGRKTVCRRTFSIVQSPRSANLRHGSAYGHVYSREGISRPPWKFLTGQWIRSGWCAREKERGKRSGDETGVTGTRGQGRPGSKGLGRARECRRHPISSQRRQPSRISGSNPRS